MKTSVKSNYRTATTKYTTSIRSVQSGHNDVHTADDFAVHFRSKVDLIRMSTSGAPPPQIICRPCASLSVLRHVTAAEITKIIVQAPTKHCSLDPAPTSLVKRLLPVLADTAWQTWSMPHFVCLSCDPQTRHCPTTAEKTDAQSR